MNTRNERFEDLLLAAQRLLEARADGMLTQDEWDALERAARACADSDPATED